MQITVRNDNVEKAITIFKKKTNDIVLSVKERDHYVKKSDANREALKRARIRELRRQKEKGR